MPWSSTDPAKERIKFVLEWERRWDEGDGRMNLADRRWPVRWRSILLGWLDAGRLDRGLILPVRARR